MVLVLKSFPSAKTSKENSILKLIKKYEKELKNKLQITELKDKFLHCPIVFANLIFSEYPNDMQCRILSGFIPPPLSAK